MIASDLSSEWVKINSCRTCESNELVNVLDLGMHPLANSLLDVDDQYEITAPLVLIRCSACTTIQLSVNVDPRFMFQNYLWVTGSTKTARQHCENLAALIVKKCDKGNLRILEIGSNDATLLQSLINKGASQVYGVDPASNLQQENLPHNIKLYEGFFNHELALKIQDEVEKVDVVVARNVLSHVPNLRDVMLGIEALVTDQSIVVIEFHDASKILTELHYESIYHEHTFYHSIRSIQAALSRIAFKIFDVSPSPISGGSHVIFASRENKEISLELEKALIDEEHSGVYHNDSWRDFASNTSNHLAQLRDIFKSEAQSTWLAFGASARSSTLLNSIGPSARILRRIVDNNPLKQGKLSPGLKLPICDPRDTVDASVEKIFICAFNFEEEITSCLSEELGWRGEVILPLPLKIRRYKVLG